jgi:hypothetical protein
MKIIMKKTLCVVVIVTMMTSLAISSSAAFVPPPPPTGSNYLLCPWNSPGSYNGLYTGKFNIESGALSIPWYTISCNSTSIKAVFTSATPTYIKVYMIKVENSAGVLVANNIIQVGSGLTPSITYTNLLTTAKYYFVYENIGSVPAINFDAEYIALI